MPFLQVLGEPLRLNYAKNRYGPHADSLRQILQGVEGHYLTGYGDGSAHVLDADPIRTLPAAVDEAAKVLAGQSETVARIDRVMDIVDGFESMYGMELLATVHCVTAQDTDATADWHRAVEGVHRWTPRKKRMFTEDHTRVAWSALHARGIATETG